MDDILQKIMEAVLGGGPTAVIAILLAIVGFLVWDRKRLIASLDKKDLKIEQIVDDYHKGNITLVEALNSLKMVMIEIKARL
jgi:uncharacterized protein YbgA (DUF1722 family)